MPNLAPALVLGAIAVLLFDAVLLGILVWPAFARRLRPGGRGVAVMQPELPPLPSIMDGVALADGVPLETYNRVVRIASWAYILFTALFVGATGLWPERQPAIFVVLAVAGALVLVVHDVLPAGRLGRLKFVLEGLVAVGLVTVIVVLTDGLRSPFFLAYPLVVAGAAFVASPAVTFGLAALATAAYLVTASSSATDGADATAVAVAGINVAALFLLTYVAFVIAREQRRTRAAAIRISTTDALTGLANRSYLLAALEREIDRGERYDRGFCLLMADLDGLKAINDTYGHWIGDRVLVAVAQVIREGIRRIDLPARLSGDEFVVLLPETDPSGAFVVAEKIRQGVADLEIRDLSDSLRTSVSIGVVAWPDAGPTVEQMMAAVDATMYVSKRRGKNRVAAGRAGSPSIMTAVSRADPESAERSAASPRQAVIVPIRDIEAAAHLRATRAANQLGLDGSDPLSAPASTGTG